MIGNAHLDPVWLWRWQEGFQETKAIFRSALDRMNEDPDFIFTSSSAQFFEWVESNDPEMFEEIKQRVAQGRLELVGGWMVQPDCNIPCGESFARQALLGQRYFHSRFQKTAVTGYNVDSFGHAGSLPQILVKSGLKNYVFMRPMPNEKGLPSRVFNWHSQDGSEILTYRIPYEYNSAPGELDAFLARLKTELKENVQELMFFYGVGNHGGGPTKENIKSIRALDADENNPHLVFSRTDMFFDSVRQSGAVIPVVEDDLQHHASGCYSAHSGVKRLNRYAENALLTAEKLSALAHVIKGLPYPDDFDRGWKNVLFNQFHDIMAGTSLVSAYEDAAYSYGESLSIAQRNINSGLQALSYAIDIPMDTSMKPIVVMNPHAWAGKMVVEIEAGGIGDQPFKLVDHTGKPVKAQLILSESVTWQRRLLFVADMPSMGYKVFYLYGKQAQAMDFEPVHVTKTTLENSRYTLKIDPATGRIISLFDKDHHVETLAQKGARYEMMTDHSDTWSHGVYKFDQNPRELQAVSIKILEKGPVRSTLRVVYRIGESSITQDVRMYQALEQIEILSDIHWHEKACALKFKVPVNVNFYRATYELPFGYIERGTNGEEEPGQSFIDLSGECAAPKTLYGMAIANDSKYSYSVDGREMSVTLLRNPVFAHHDPHELEEGVAYEYVDDGRQKVLMALLPHTGTWKDSNIMHIAQETNIRPLALFETYHKGILPLENSFVSVSDASVVISALKQAQDGDGLILRAYETHKKAVDVTIDLPFIQRTLTLHFNPCEIRTFKLPYDPALDVIETSLLEW